jgi:hypothetical protein
MISANSFFTNNSKSYRPYLLNLGCEGIEIDEQVDTSVSKGRHAALVVGIGIHVVDSDGVGAQLGHAYDIALALGSVDKGIVGSQLIGDTWDSS